MVISIFAGSETAGVCLAALALLTISLFAFSGEFPLGQEGGARPSPPSAIVQPIPQPVAHWVSRDWIAWRVEVPAGASVWLESGVEGDPLPLTLDPFAPNAAVREKFPHLVGLPFFRIGEADLPKAARWLKGPVRVVLRTGSGPLEAAGLQLAGVLDDLYTYDDQLGVVFFNGVPTLKLWAPTAWSVRLRVYDDADPASRFESFSMTEDPATGVWSVIGELDWNRKYYLYEVEVYSPWTGRYDRNLVTDPYSLSLSADGRRSQIVRLSDADLTPDGWAGLAKPPLESPENIVVYELHVRDFSVGDESVPEALRGTFLALVWPGSNGRRHLEALAQAGLSHVHLLPVFDFATVPERRADQLQVGADLAGFGPDSELQQKAVEKIKERDGFNWGYDPAHYTVPEGSYATEPDGPVRIREFREMVAALNGMGLRVVMDVVYNHTHAAGLADGSVLDKIVPGYYHRLDGQGRAEMSSCCPNTASEHAMMGKLMVDSILTWAREYKVDGFRFDLMGHHMKSNLLAVRRRLDRLTPAQDGVSGREIYLYGEGWDFGEVAGNARGVNATQTNMAGSGVGTFNDRLRDGVRGGTPFSDPRDQGFATGLFLDPNGFPQGDEKDKLLRYTDWIRLGLAGNLADFEFVDRTGRRVAGRDVEYQGSRAGYTRDPQENIVYVSAHDNETLFDAIQMKASAATPLAQRIRMQNLAISLTALAQGVPFFHAGVEMLRSKSMDRDSFNSGDWFNRLDFTYQTNNWGVGLPPAEKNQEKWPLMRPLLGDPDLRPTREDILKSVHHFREMLQIRRGSRLLRLTTAAEILSKVSFLNTGPDQIPGLIVMRVDGGHESVVVLFNARPQPASFQVAELQGKDFELHPVLRESHDPVVRAARFDAASGTFHVPSRTTAVFVR